MKRKNISKGKSEAREKIIEKTKKEPEKHKSFKDVDLYMDDSDDSIEDTVTQFSNKNRNKKMSIDRFDITDSLSKRQIRKNSLCSPSKHRNSSKNLEHVDLKKKLFEYNIIDSETNDEDPLNNFKKNKKKEAFVYNDYDSYPFDHSAIKHIDFDIKISLDKFESVHQKINNVNNITIQNLKKFNAMDYLTNNPKNDYSHEISALKNSLLNYFHKNILFYYEFENPKSLMNKTRELDNDSFGSNSENMNGAKIASYKDDVYVDALNHIFSSILDSKNNDKFSARVLSTFSHKSGGQFSNSTFPSESIDEASGLNNENKFFYIVLPLYACYFFNNLNSTLWKDRKEIISENGILISNMSKNLQKKLEDCEIEFTHISRNLRDVGMNNNSTSAGNNHNSLHNTNSRKKQVDKNNKNTTAILADYSNIYIQADNAEGAESSIIYIKNFNQILYFNEFLNSHEESNFKILSPFPFSNSQCKKNHFTLEIMNNKEIFSVKIKIIGCIFQNHLRKLLFLLESISNEFCFSINQFYKTPPFYLCNEKLNHPVEHIKFEKNKYLIRVKK